MNPLINKLKEIIEKTCPNKISSLILADFLMIVADENLNYDYQIINRLYEYLPTLK